MESRSEVLRARLAVRLAQAAGCYAAAIGLLVLLGYATGHQFLPTPSRIAMKFNTAICAIACGVAIVLFSNGYASRPRRTAGMLLAVLAGLIGAATLLEHLTGWDLHIDQLIVNETPGEAATTSPGRMGPPGSISFMLLGAALLLRDMGLQRLVSALLLIVCSLSLLALTGFAFGVDQLYGVARYTGVAMMTSTVLMALAAAGLGIRPTTGPVGTMIRSDAGGALMRRGLPVIVSLPLFLGATRLKMQNWLVIQPGFGTSVLVVSLIILLAAFLWWAAANLGVSERRRTAAFDVALDCIITMDAAGNVVEWNTAAERTFGYTAQEAIGRSVAELIIPPALRAAHWAGMRRCVDSGGTKGEVIGRRIELSALHKSGNEFPIELALSATRTSGAPESGLLFTAYARDITAARQARADVSTHVQQIEELNRRLLEANTALGHERSQLETTIAARTRELEESYQRLRLAERTAILGTLTAGLGHDMANLLLPVRARLDVLGRMKLPPEAQQDLDAIGAASEYLQRLANSLRMMTYETDDDSETKSAATSLAAWWPDAEPIMRATLGRGLVLESLIPESLPPVRIPRHRLTQAVFNLVVNAADAMRPRGHGRVKIWAEPTETAEGPRVRLHVTDDGPGMTEEVRRRCLEPYFSTKTRKLGTGIGLALVRALVERAGGKVDVQSSPGQGATFTLELPAVSAAGSRQNRLKRAAVRLSDPRSRAYTASLLRALDVELAEELSAADLLVVDGVVDPAMIRAFMSEHSTGNGSRSRRVVFFGSSQHDGWVCTGESPTPATIRSALAKALEEVSTT